MCLGERRGGADLAGAGQLQRGGRASPVRYRFQVGPNMLLLLGWTYQDSGYLFFLTVRFGIGSSFFSRVGLDLDQLQPGPQPGVYKAYISTIKGLHTNRHRYLTN